jgi:1-acyl-sn-glycerol-3-phosphate acyltransferase
MEDWKLEPARDLGLPLGQRLRSVRRERGTLPWMFHLFCWSGARAALHVLHRLKIEGREHLPRTGPFILVANHCSHLDTVVLGCALPWRLRPEAFPIAAGDAFFKTPAMAALSALFVNALPMWRKGAVSHSLADLRARLNEGRCIYIIFPEGTRSRDGTMGPFKSGLGMIVAQTPVPVVPCRLWGTFQAMPPGKKLPRPGRVRLRIGKAMSFESTFNDRAGWDHIAKSIHEAVSGLG